MKLSQYGYEFAPEMLAKHPTENRDDSRLMVINRAKGTVEHRIFKACCYMSNVYEIGSRSQAISSL